MANVKALSYKSKRSEELFSKSLLRSINAYKGGIKGFVESFYDNRKDLPDPGNADERAFFMTWKDWTTPRFRNLSSAKMLRKIGFSDEEIDAICKADGKRYDPGYDFVMNGYTHAGLRMIRNYAKTNGKGGMGQPKYWLVIVLDTNATTVWERPFATVRDARKKAASLYQRDFDTIIVVEATSKPTIGINQRRKLIGYVKGGGQVWEDASGKTYHLNKDGSIRK